MPRSPRVRFPGAIYHVMSRGNERRSIFEDDADRLRFLRMLGAMIDRYHVLCHAYCLMPNHYHLVLETPEANLSPAMQQLNGDYGRSYNRRYERAGHLFQGRFKAVLVEKQSYLLELARYVVLNPVRAGIVRRPHDWPWSSFRATAGLERRPGYLFVDGILGCFGDRPPSRARERYVGFVNAGIDRVDGFVERIRREPVVGGPDFLARYRESVAEQSSPVREVSRKSLHAGRPGLASLLAGIVDRSDRNHRILAAHRKHGYTISEIARHLGIHRTTVSRVVGRPEMRQFTV